MSPFSKGGGDMLVHPCPLGCLTLCCESSVLWVCLPIISLHSFVSCRRLNTRRWPNAGLMLAYRLRRWPTLSPVLGYCVVFGATLNVGQHHRRWANINPALAQSIMMTYCQHAGTSNMKYWLRLNAYWPAPATLAQHSTDIGSVSACDRRPAVLSNKRPAVIPSKHKRFV